jgi:GNAT superfamily N-acetyltransferase
MTPAQAAPPAQPLEFQWKPQPLAEQLVREVVHDVLRRVPAAEEFARRLGDEAGVRFADLVDTIHLPAGDQRCQRLPRAGWEPAADPSQFHNPLGLFPRVMIRDESTPGPLRVDLKVESAVDFVAANGIEAEIAGPPGAACRQAEVFRAGGAAVAVVERHGWNGRCDTAPMRDLAAFAAVAESFRLRRRRFDDEHEGFGLAERLIDRAVAAVGRDAACDLFFAAEREYWQRRNRAARVQKARQDRLGIGWANHDHHTYRSSRRHFARLCGLWERLGFTTRERFYAGAEAGWGAQVMEHPATGVVTFNDVDLSPDELMTNFAHDPLPDRDRLGTVGLWCGLHGESVLEAGMHHLECTFDFASLKQQLEAEAGVKTMKPFTDFPYLKQAFTEGERWPVREERAERLLAAKLITPTQAETFLREGAIGSHLENLERNEGFKGFNQKGVSEIIEATDPRRQSRRE